MAELRVELWVVLKAALKAVQSGASLVVAKAVLWVVATVVR